MKKHLLLLAVLILGIFAYGQDHRPALLVRDDPQAREEYEFNRLKNPYTGEIPENIRERVLSYVLSSKSGLQSRLKSTSITWSQRGPWNAGGRTRALAIDITDHNRILAGGVSGGIWISTDGGSSWTKSTITNDDHSPSVTAIAQDPSNTQIWYYAGGEYYGNSTSGGGASYRNGGVYKSTDGGLTWTKIKSAGHISDFDSYFDYVYDIKVADNGYAFFACYGGIYRTTDQGQTFSLVLDSDPNNTYNYSRSSDVEIGSNGVIYAVLGSNGDKHGVFKSTDNGTTWTDITPSSSSGFANDYKRMVLAAVPGQDSVYVLGYRYTDNSEKEHCLLWLYDNLDDTWYDLSANIPALGGKTGDFDSQGGYDLVIKVKPDDPYLVYIGGTNLFFSTDGFTTSYHIYWAGGYTPKNDSYNTYTNHHPDQHSLVFDPTNPLILYSGHDGGLSKTTNSEDITTNSNDETIDWVSLDNGYLTTQAYALDIEPTGTYSDLIIAGFQDNGTWLTQSTNLQDSWSRKLGGDGAYCAIGPKANVILESSQKGSTYGELYDNNGNYVGWAYASPNLNDPLFIAPFALDPTGNILYYLDDTVIWRNNDLINNLNNNLSNTTVPSGWEKLTNTIITNDYYSAISVSTNPANIVFAGTAYGKVYKIVSANTGSPTMTDITGSNFPSGYVSSIAVDPTDANNLIVTFSNYGIPSIFYSTDGGTSWTDISGNLEENPDGSGDGPSVRWAAFLNYDGNKYFFVGTCTGLYMAKSSEPSQWTQAGSSIIGNTVVDMVKTRDVDGLVVVATHGNGIFSGKLVTSTHLQNTTANHSLTIYPNPITQKTATVILPQPLGKLLVYDIKGQLVYFSSPKQEKHVMHLESLKPGTYSVVYYINNQTFTQKIIIK